MLDAHLRGGCSPARSAALAVICARCSHANNGSGGDQSKRYRLCVATDEADEHSATQRSPGRFDHEDRSALGILGGSHAAEHFYAAGIALTYPFVIAQFHISVVVLGVVAGIASVLTGVLQLLAGLFRRFSTRLLLGLQDVGVALFSLLGAVAPGFALFGGARIGSSLVYWPQHPVGSAYLTDRFPRRRGLVLSWHTTAGSIGTVIAPLTVAAIIAATSWRVALVVLAVPLLVAAVVVGTRLPRDSSQLRRRGTTHPPKADQTGPPLPSSTGTEGAEPRNVVTTRSLLTQRRVLALLLAGLLSAAGSGLGVLTTYVPLYLRSSLHLSTLTVGAEDTVLVAAGVVGPLLAGWLSDRLERRLVLTVSYLVGAAAFLVYGSVGANLVGLTISGVVVGVFAYATSPLLQAAFSDVAAGAEARSAFGVFFAVAQGLGGFWITVIGVIISSVGYFGAFVVMAGTYVVSAAILVAVMSAGPHRKGRASAIAVERPR